jgi:Nitroreductase
MSLIEAMQKRRSIRKYTDEKIDDAVIENILRAGMLAESGKAIRPWEFIVVRDRGMLDKMAKCRVGAAKMLEGADCAILVIADPAATDVWIEDCSVVMANMHLLADSSGIGSCWIQARMRTAENGETTEDYLRSLLGFPEGMKAEAMLSLGMPAVHPAPYALDKLPLEKVHREKY